MGTIMTVALLFSAVAFTAVTKGLFRATGLRPHRMPVLWEERHAEEIGKLVERSDWRALREVVQRFSDQSRSVTFYPKFGDPISIEGVPFESERIEQRVYQTDRWVHEVGPTVVTRATPARDSEGRILGVLVLRMMGGPEIDERNKPHLNQAKLGSALIAGLLIWLLTLSQGRRLSRRLEQFTRAAVQISKGQLTRLEIPVVPKDLAELAQAFNSMAIQLEERRVKLERARERAETADQMRRDFMAEIAHSLGTPLSAVRLGLAELKQKSQQTGWKSEIQELEDRVEWLGQTTRRLVKLACWEMVEPEIHAGRVDLLDPIVYVLELLETKLLTAEIEVELGRFLAVAVEADEDALRNIFNALIENCIQHSGGQCTLTVEAEERPGGLVDVVLWDSGVGMSEETLSHAQDRYFTLGRTGLGLAIVKRLLNAHGTELEIESKLGIGTAFRFTLRRG